MNNVDLTEKTGVNLGSPAFLKAPATLDLSNKHFEPVPFMIYCLHFFKNYWPHMHCLNYSEFQQFATPDNKANISQIDGPTPKNSFGFQVSQQNFQDAKALHEVWN